MSAVAVSERTLQPFRASQENPSHSLSVIQSHCVPFSQSKHLKTTELEQNDQPAELLQTHCGTDNAVQSEILAEIPISQGESLRTDGPGKESEPVFCEVGTNQTLPQTQKKHSKATMISHCPRVDPQVLAASLSNDDDNDIEIDQDAPQPSAILSKWW